MHPIERGKPLIILLACLLAQGCFFITPMFPGSNRGPVAVEVLDEAKGAFTRAQILMIPLDGLVEQGDTSEAFSQPGMLVSLKDRLLAAEKNPNIKAIVLRIDSPGGTVTASDLIHREIKQFKEKRKIPVIALLDGTAASGGLYIAMAADEIYALPTTLTGSIGVISVFPGLTGLSQKIGLEMNVIKSGANKDAGSPWRPMSDADRQLFQQLVDHYYARFLSVIRESRAAKGLTDEALKALADGRVFNPQTALDAKLIDGIQYPDEVFKLARERAGVSDATIVSYEYRWSYRGHTEAASRVPAPRADSSPRASGDINLIKIDGRSLAETFAGGQFLYLWMP